MTTKPGDPLIGASLANFRIEKLLGHGGMAAVYYGWDVKLQRPVAIKVIDARNPNNLSYAKRLVSEARVVARWHHENISQVYYADQQDGLYFFAMEFLAGMDLGQLMTEYYEVGTLLPTADILRIGRAIATALDYAHHNGVIHRDVKPSNVMITADGRVVLTDFGLAMDIHEGTLGEVFGTPYYIAPEQARSSAEAVPQSDLYSLAVILFEMLTGSVPFDDPSPVSLALKHLADPPPLPTSINPAINIPTEAVLLKALSKDPADRYSTGQALISALEAALETGPSPFVSPDDPAIPPTSDMPVVDQVNRELKKRQTLPGIPATVQAKRPRARTTVNAAVKSPVIEPRRPPRRLFPTWWLVAGAVVVGVVIIGTISALALLSSGGEIASVTSTAGSIETAPSSPSELLAPITQTPSLEPAFATPEVQTEPPLPATAAPAATVLYPDGYQLILYYTQRGFYLRNPGDKSVEIARIAFEALDSSTGLPANYRFEGKSWAQYFPKIEPRKCDILEIARSSAYLLRPSDCQFFNAQRTPSSQSEEIFWLPRENVTQFRILWDGLEVARCDTEAQGCVIYVPQE